MRVHIILGNQPVLSNESAHYIREPTSTKQCEYMLLSRETAASFDRVRTHDWLATTNHQLLVKCVNHLSTVLLVCKV